MIAIELFGIPRLRAGTGLIRLDASSVEQALRELGVVCPELGVWVLQRGRLHEACKLSINGERFVSDLQTPLKEGDTLLLLSADMGG
jgi:molybdopterin converting factor small subunit